MCIPVTLCLRPNNLLYSSMRLNYKIECIKSLTIGVCLNHKLKQINDIKKLITVVVQHNKHRANDEKIRWISEHKTLTISQTKK
jgi:hypothetical protein